jgi:glyoxylase-like metal-dependent hydrolase (beta-lactamase superfamily II)
MSSLESIQVLDNLYRIIETNGNNKVNIYLLVGENDNILIDTGYNNRGEELLETIGKISGNPIKLYINTHHHADHTGANELFTCPGISHKNARERIGGKLFHLPVYIGKGVPAIAIQSNLSIYHDEEHLQLRALHPAHSDGDLLVYLEKKKILIMGDLLFSENLPFIDLNSGGDIKAVMQLYRDIPELYPDCRTLCAGHGAPQSMEEFKKYRDVIITSSEFIFDHLDKGWKIEAIADDSQYREILNQLKDREKFASLWIESHKEYRSGRKTICEPLSSILENEGLKPALEFFRKEKERREFRTEEVDITIFSYNLMFRKRDDQARAFFQLYTDLWPESANSWDSMGEFLLYSGDKEKGREYYKKALEMDPQRTYIIEILDKIGS